MLVALAGMGLVVVALGVYARRRGAALRALGLALVLVALADPSLVREDRQPLKDVVAVVLDRSGSQTIGERWAQTDKARAEIAERARRARQYRDALRRRRHDDGGNDGTRLFSALNSALADVPPERIRRCDPRHRR